MQTWNTATGAGEADRGHFVLTVESHPTTGKDRGRPGVVCGSRWCTLGPFVPGRRTVCSSLYRTEPLGWWVPGVHGDSVGRVPGRPESSGSSFTSESFLPPPKPWGVWDTPVGCQWATPVPDTGRFPQDRVQGVSATVDPAARDVKTGIPSYLPGGFGGPSTRVFTRPHPPPTLSVCLLPEALGVCASLGRSLPRTGRPPVYVVSASDPATDLSCFRAGRVT